MRIDEQTIRDLEIRGATVGAGLLDHLDRTRTRAGREAFARRLTRPLASPGAIRDVQAALRFIAANRRSFDGLPDQAQVAQIERYLDSRFVTLGRSSGPGVGIQSVWVWLRHRDLYEEARRGLGWLDAFLSRVESAVEAARAAPEPLSLLAEEGAALLESRALASLQPRERLLELPHHTLLRDHAARDGGRAPLLRLIALVGEIEALVAMSDATADFGFVLPTVLDDGSGLEMEGVFHPFLASPISNDLRLNAGSLLFVTGPNMAGKTTFLKACGVAALLAHTGMGVPARRCTIGFFDRLMTALRTEDSIRDGVSYFQAEARRVHAMVEPVARGERSLIIADELFRGTNVKDACDATTTVLETLATAACGRLLVASHLTEVADRLAHLPGIVHMHFAAKVDDGVLSFDYRLQPGVSTQRLGMLVLEKEGVLSALADVRSVDRRVPETLPQQDL